MIDPQYHDVSSEVPIVKLRDITSLNSITGCFRVIIKNENGELKNLVREVNEVYGEYTSMYPKKFKIKFGQDMKLVAFSQLEGGKVWRNLLIPYSLLDIICWADVELMPIKMDSTNKTNVFRIYRIHTAPEYTEALFRRMRFSEVNQEIEMNERRIQERLARPPPVVPQVFNNRYTYNNTGGKRLVPWTSQSNSQSQQTQYVVKSQQSNTFCSAIAKSTGLPCKKKAVAGQRYCHQHLPKTE